MTATNVAGTSAISPSSSAVTPATVPDRPEGVTALRGNKFATVNWSESAANGSPVLTYTVTASNGKSLVVKGNLRTLKFTGLSNGTKYTFKVKATNSVGSSPTSLTTAPVTPADKPSQVAKPTAKAGNTTAVVTWKAPANNGAAITGYTITSAPGGTTTTVQGNVQSTTITGLTSGTTYTFTVKAINDVGTGVASVKTVSVTIL